MGKLAGSTPCRTNACRRAASRRGSPRRGCFRCAFQRRRIERAKRARANTCSRVLPCPARYARRAKRGWRERGGGFLLRTSHYLRIPVIMTQQQKGLPTVSVRLPDDLRERLDALAITTGRPRTWYVKEAIIKHLGEIEAKYKIEQARLEQYEKTRSPHQWG